LYLGNNPDATGFVLAGIPGYGPFESCFDWPGIVRAVESKVGHRLSHSDISDHFEQKAFDFIRDTPKRVAELLLKKTLMFWGPLEVSHNRQDEIVRTESSVLRFLPLRFAWAFGLAVFGVIALLLERRRSGNSVAYSGRVQLALLLGLFTLSVFVAHLPFFVAGRYRVPVVPALLMLGAWGLTYLWNAVEVRAFKRAGLGLAAATALVVLLSFNVTGYQPDRTEWEFRRATAYMQTQQFSIAAETFKRVLKEAPLYWRARHNLILALLVTGDTAGARRQLEEARALEASADFVNNLERIFKEFERLQQKP
jgi:4-amino-4-deoxy-L-arabinose transferase-like glycosyltransferase